MKKRKWIRAALKAAFHRTTTVNLIVTRRCDLACSYCRAVRKTPEITVENWLAIASRLSSKFSVFTVSGGEPLLYPDLPKLINGLSRIGLAGLCTNLRRIDSAFLESSDELDYLNFSIDQLDGESASRKDSFGKIPLLLEFSKRNRFALYGTAVITWRNVEAIPALAEYMHASGIPLNLQLVQNPTTENAFCSDDRLQRLHQLQQELLAMKRAGFAIEESDAYLEGMQAFVTGGRSVKCLAGESYLAVDTDGRLMACQDSNAWGPPLHEVDDVAALLDRVKFSKRPGCRCWWNCYHRYARWNENPWRLLAEDQISVLGQQLRRFKRSPLR